MRVYVTQILKLPTGGFFLACFNKCGEIKLSHDNFFVIGGFLDLSTLHIHVVENAKFLDYQKVVQFYMLY